jgi:AraC-like DNA-binding protein
VPHFHDIVRTADVAVVRTACAGGPAEPEMEAGYEIVMVRRGTFRRELEHSASVVDSTSVYVARPGQWQHIHHVHGTGDAGYLVQFDAHLVGDDAERLPGTPVRLAPAADVAIRRLAGGGGDDDLAIDETVARLLDTLAAGDDTTTTARRPRVTRAGVAAIEQVRVLLAIEVDARTPPRRLAALAAAVGYAPHHLSRLFTAVTGTTMARHRRALRARMAVDRIERGDGDLAAVAADAGFADHSHLVRAIRAEYAMTPSQLRTALSAAAG